MHHLAEVEDDSDESFQVEHDLEKCEENVKTWDQMRCVLEMWGGKHFCQSEYRISANFQLLALKYDFF